MKYGILFNKNNMNIGDDIQAYATALFLPSFDYIIDREHIDEFVPENGEPVAVIMNAWYMWNKWNWPPSRYIYPCFVGFHYADHQLAKQPGSPFKYEFLTGIGGDYLRAYEPVGCRDNFTREQLEKLGIRSYFSGCITMTLPKMPERKDRGTYICLVDVEKRVSDKIKAQLKDEDIEIRVVTHNRERNENLSWEDRVKIVTDLLTLYQNARCVVTRRLHCALPCLAMETPVFLIKETEDDIRFSPYNDFLHRVTVTRFMRDEYTYDFLNPPENKPLYKKYRASLIETVKQFVADTEKVEGPVEEIVRTSYTPEEVMRWRHDLMKVSMDRWYLEYREAQVSLRKKTKENENLGKKKQQLEKDVKAVRKEKKQLEKQIRQLSAELEERKHPLKLLARKVRGAVKTFSAAAL
ncbi:MAG: polysaccharide pyruvyl transferase family protein [Clostridiales bacterium]|nr:polysaccharide pyruvyl transferase family protein [Clostridiales bacterium]